MYIQIVYINYAIVKCVHVVHVHVHSDYLEATKK